MFIFQIRESVSENTISELSEYIKQCHIKQVPEEKYLLISHYDGKNNGKYREDILNGYITGSNGITKNLSQEMVKIQLFNPMSAVSYSK